MEFLDELEDANIPETKIDALQGVEPTLADDLMESEEPEIVEA